MVAARTITESDSTLTFASDVITEQLDLKLNRGVTYNFQNDSARTIKFLNDGWRCRRDPAGESGQFSVPPEMEQNPVVQGTDAENQSISSNLDTSGRSRKRWPCPC